MGISDRTEVRIGKPLKFRVFWDVLPCSQIDVDIDLRMRQYTQKTLNFILAAVRT
jgi:hypothetical protein